MYTAAMNCLQNASNNLMFPSFIFLFSCAPFSVYYLEFFNFSNGKMHFDIPTEVIIPSFLGGQCWNSMWTEPSNTVDVKGKK